MSMVEFWITLFILLLLIIGHRSEKSLKKKEKELLQFYIKIIESSPHLSPRDIKRAFKNKFAVSNPDVYYKRAKMLYTDLKKAQEIYSKHTKKECRQRMLLIHGAHRGRMLCKIVENLNS